MISGNVRADRGNAAQVKRLLASAACLAAIDAGDKRSFTAFHIACAGGHTATVQLLLEAGCDTSLTNDVGYTGWDLAASLHRTEVTALREGEAGAGAGARAEAGGSRRSAGKPGKRGSDRPAPRGEEPPAAEPPASGGDELEGSSRRVVL